MGKRNPQGIAFYPHTGELWLKEHGPEGGDEINLMEAGQNYGWPYHRWRGLLRRAHRRGA